MLVLLINNHTVFLVRFEINMHLHLHTEIALAEAARVISAL